MRSCGVEARSTNTSATRCWRSGTRRLDDRTPEANACAAALDLRDVLVRINEEFRYQNQIPSDLRIGIATGPCAVGPMGSRRRFEYSCFGDTVNRASTLERSTRQYRVPIVMDEATAHAVDRRFAVLELDTVLVKGAERPHRLYGLFGDDALRAEPRFQAFAEEYTAARAAQLTRDWTRAVEANSAASACSVPGVDTALLCQTQLSAIERARQSAGA